MLKKLRIFVGIVLNFVFLLLASQVWANAESGGYLKYQEPQPAASSWLATSGYIFSLVLTFFLVLGLAYFTSKFLGQRMISSRGFGSGKIYATLSLGASRAVYVVEIAGKFMILGVTEHNIVLLDEITSPDVIEQLKNSQDRMPTEQFSSVFQRQLGLLSQIQKKFPHTFSSDNTEFRVKEHENDSRKR